MVSDLGVLALAIAGIVFIVAWTEFDARRSYRRANERDPKIWGALFYSAPIDRVPRQKIAFRLYGIDATPLLTADFSLNNMGLISRHDYAYGRGGADEFRILVIGGEQTASSVADVSWPDVLQDELQAKDPSRTYKVFNLGWPDAGPEHYVKYWQEEGPKFEPDLVIVNYVESDFYRTISGTPVTYQGQSLGWAEVTYAAGPMPDDTARLTARVVEGSPGTSFEDPRVIASRPYGFHTTGWGVLSDRAKVLAIQKQVVRDMIKGTIRRLRPLAGKPNPPMVAVYRDFDRQLPVPVDENALVEFGVQTFGWLARNVPNLLLTHNFNLYERRTEWTLTQRMVARDPAIKVVDMRTYAPPDATDEALEPWYWIPHMGEKWSNLGHRAMGEMMARAVLDWQAAQRKPPASSLQMQGVVGEKS